jgi:D-alanyl-D-alanine carboxypeptidase
MMTLRARSLGMGRTTFMNASGLPNGAQWTTSRDLAILARRLILDFPGYYRFFAVPSFAWHRQVIFNHDQMLRTYPGADGLKTGFTEASGHNLVTSAVRGGVRLIGVVLGAASNPERDAHMAVLLDRGFEQMDVAGVRVASAAPRATLISVARAETARPAVRQRAASWGVQVGSFGTEAAARAMATAVRREQEAGVAHAAAVTLRGKTVWRAEVLGLTQADAHDACADHRKSGCLIIRPDAHQFAGR